MVDQGRSHSLVYTSASRSPGTLTLQHRSTVVAHSIKRLTNSSMDDGTTPSSSQRLKLHGSRLEFDQPNEDHELRDGWQWLFATFNDYLQPDSTMSLDEAIRLATKYFDYGDLGMIAVYSVAIVLGDQIPYDNPAQSKLGHFLIAFCESDEWLSSPNLEKGYSASMLRKRFVER